MGARAPRPVVATTTRAFEHGRAAAGAKYIREGFGRTADEDLQWALGWPHAITLVDGDDSDAALAKAEDDVFGRAYAAALAPRFVRRLFTGSGAERGPIDAAEVRETLRSNLAARHWPSTAVSNERLVGLCEALLGPTALADILVEELVALSDAKLLEHNPANAEAAAHVGLLLLRVQTKHATALRKTIAKRIAKVNTDEMNHLSVLRALGYANDPSIAVPMDLVHWRLEPQDPMALLVNDDPALVARVVAEVEDASSYSRLLARHLFTGGDEVLATYAQVYKKVSRSGLLEVAHGLARMSSPKARKLLQAMAKDSKAKAVAAKLLKT